MKNTGFPEDSAPVRKDYFNRRIEDPFFQLKAVTKILKRSTGFIILFYHFFINDFYYLIICIM